MTAYADFRFASTGDLAYLGGPASRFNHNMTAINLLKSLEAEGRAHGDLASVEQRTFARYSGWGDGEVLNRLFPYGAFPQAPIHPELDGVLTIAERGKIASSVLNAHYPELPITGAIYEALNYLGTGPPDPLRVLEPAAGITDFKRHDLRHDAATNMVESGASLIEVRDILGHSDIRMTQRYAHAKEQGVHQAVARLVDRAKKIVPNLSQKKKSRPGGLL